MFSKLQSFLRQISGSASVHATVLISAAVRVNVSGSAFVRAIFYVSAAGGIYEILSKRQNIEKEEPSSTTAQDKGGIDGFLFKRKINEEMSFKKTKGGVDGFLFKREINEEVEMSFKKTKE